MFRPSHALRPLALGAAVLTVLAGASAIPHQATAATVTPTATTTKHRVLFDNSKAETAGNADWIISTSQPDPLAENANPQTETDWTGAISSWGVALQKTGRGWTGTAAPTPTPSPRR